MTTGGQFLTLITGSETTFSPDNFSDIQKEFSRAAEDFARNEISPQSDTLEKFDRELTRKLIRSCGELGFLGLDVPEEYGGLGLDKVTSSIVVEKITEGRSQSFTVTFVAHSGIGTLPVVYFGNKEQKKKYLAKLANGEFLGAYALSEAGSGSDALSIHTEAHLSENGNYYVINGNKQFISNGGWADVLITFAKVNGTEMSGFIIDPKSEGITIHEEKNKLGLHGSSTCNIILENVKVPAENLLGKIGKGADIAFNTLNIGRFKLGAAVLGGCKTVIREASQYTLERRQFGQAVAGFEAIKKKIADMAIQTFALESIIYQTAHLLDQSISTVDPKSPAYSYEIANAIEKFALECSICKVVGSESYWHIADEGLQSLGGYGYIEDYPMARKLRDTRIDRIYEGTNEINRQIITGYLLKKTLVEELPIREKIKKLTTSGRVTIPTFKGDRLAREKRAVEAAKNLLLLLFNEAIIRFGQDLLNHEQLGELFSDMISDLFILDTTLSRIGQQEEQVSFPAERLHLGTVLTVEKMAGFAEKAKLMINGILSGDELDKFLSLIRIYERYLIIPADIFDLKNRIAEVVYQVKKYPF
jgi:alkylation response protein AidB-like acyl-CoA dehydrogenase